MYRLCYQWLEQTCLCEENRWQLCSLLRLQEVLFVEQGDSLQKLCRGCAWLVRGATAKGGISLEGEQLFVIPDLCVFPVHEMINQIESKFWAAFIPVKDPHLCDISNR